MLSARCAAERACVRSGYSDCAERRRGPGCRRWWVSAGVAWARRNAAIAEESGLRGGVGVGTLYGGSLSLTPRNPTSRLTTPRFLRL